MQGHSAANMVPIVAANRIGREAGQSCEISFFGGSFITGGTGALLADARNDNGVVTAAVDLHALQTARAALGLFRDRRPDLYLPLLSLDGSE